MQTLVPLSPERIDQEVRAIREAARKRPKTREAALAFLKSIGADRWPNSPTRVNGGNVHRKKK